MMLLPAPLSPGSLYHVDDVDVVLLAHDPEGFSHVATESLPDYSLEDLNLQAGRLLDDGQLDAVRAEIALRKDGVATQMSEWNESRPLPCWYGHDGSVLTLGVSRRDYVTRRTFHTMWEQATGELREAVVTRVLDGGITPLFAGTVGVHLTLTTADGRFVVAERSSRTRSFAGHRCLPVMEGAHDGDRIDGQLDLTRSAVRGVNEELGLAITGAEVNFHSLWLELDTYGVVLQGHLDLRDQGLDLRAVKTSWATARDGWETDQLFDVPHDPGALDALTANFSTPWLPWARFAAGLHRNWMWPDSAVR